MAYLSTQKNDPNFICNMYGTHLSPAALQKVILNESLFIRLLGWRWRWLSWPAEDGGGTSTAGVKSAIKFFIAC